MTAEAVVDRFVATLRRDGVRVEAIDGAPWLSSFEERFPGRFPAPYAALVHRYRFTAFDRGGVSFFGNMGEGSEDDLVVAAARDRHLSGPALSAGLLQIGRPDIGAYDPVCLDGREVKSRREYPLVLLDHEALLRFQRVVVIEEIDESFLSFMLNNGAAARRAGQARR